MRTAIEFWSLTRDTLGLWSRAFTRLGFWFCAGYLIQSAGLWAAVAIGPKHQVLSNLAFIAGEVGYVAALILMLYSARSELRSPRLLATGHRPGVPPTVFGNESALTTLLLAIGPFLAVYSLWGMVDERVRALFRVNAQAFGLSAEEWSVGFDRWMTYAGIAVAALALRLVLSVVVARFDRTWLRVLVVACEGTWVFASFFVLTRAATPVWGWLITRSFWVGAENGWYRFAASLPEWPLLSGWTLPRAVQEGWGWFWTTFLPGLSLSVLLPLVWLALVAVVHGWRQFRARDVLFGRHVRRGIEATLPRWLSWATSDLRGKYLPVASALRLILNAGPRFLGVYLVLATLIRIGQEWLGWLFAVITGVRPVNQAVAFGYLWDFLAGFIGMTLLAALHLTAFDRGIAATAGISPSPVQQDDPIGTGHPDHR